LLRNDAYLAPYPSLAAFLAQHPEVAHNPAYFLGSPQRDFYAERDPAIERARSIENVFSSFAMLIGFMSLFGLLGWMTKTLMESRRWSRMSKLQTEAHAKVIERLTSSEGAGCHCRGHVAAVARPMRPGPSRACRGMQHRPRRRRRRLRSGSGRGF
jgi:hypothetical protein